MLDSSSPPYSSAEFPAAAAALASFGRITFCEALLWMAAFVRVLLAVDRWLGSQICGGYLPARQPPLSILDVILVLGGGLDDSRYWRGVELMKAGYAAGKIVLDAEASDKKYGKSNADLANEFLASVNAQHTTLCPVYGDSTFAETEDVARCLAPMKVSSVLIVTSDYHTRRAFDIFKARLPHYHWSIAGVYAPYEDQTTKRLAGDNWWRNRRWAKTVADEWERLLWWELVDRWRSHLVVQA